MKLFGKAKKAPTPRETITKMRETIEMLEKREAFLQNKINHEIQEAKKFMAAKNKRGILVTAYNLQYIVLPHVWNH